MENTTKTRTNAYAAPCADCTTRVEAGEGTLTREGGRWVTRHNAPTECRIPETVDPEFVRWLGKVLLEEGGRDGAWRVIAESNEFWDGEPEPEAYARRRFEAALPLAEAQNRAIHPDWVQPIPPAFTKGSDPIANLTPYRRLAVKTDEGTAGQPIRFFRISKPRRNGRIYIDQEFGGGNYSDAASIASDGRVWVASPEMRRLLVAAAANEEAAWHLYATEKDACYVCASDLSDWQSRALHIGPTCDSRKGKVRKQAALDAGGIPE